MRCQYPGDEAIDSVVDDAIQLHDVKLIYLLFLMETLVRLTNW